MKITESTNLDMTTIYTLYYKRVYQISYNIVKDPYLAEDIVQETFIKAIKHLDSIKEARKVGAWLSVIASRTAIDFLRKERNKKGIVMDQEMLDYLGKEMKQNVAEDVEVSMLSEEVSLAISKLTSNCKSVLVLRLEKGLKDQEIAHVLDLTLATVKTRIYRARKQLKRMFEDQMSA